MTHREMYRDGTDLDRRYVERRMYDAEVDARGWSRHARESFATAENYAKRGQYAFAWEWLEHAERVTVHARRMLQAYRAKLRDVFGP